MQFARILVVMGGIRHHLWRQLLPQRCVLTLRVLVARHLFPVCLLSPFRRKEATTDIARNPIHF